MAKFVGSLESSADKRDALQANELLGLMEELERHSTEGTLQAWLLEYMYQLLTEEEDDTVGCCAACEDILANLKPPRKG